MAAPDLQKEIQKKLKELLRLTNRVLPVKVGRAVRDSVRENFRKGGFYGTPWQAPLRTQLGIGGPGYGPLLSGTNHLMMSTDYIPGEGRVIIQNTLVYAPIHNDGGSITVTAKMKGFFWAQHYKARGDAKELSAEAQFWRNMALKKVGSQIKIVQRQFLGEHPEVNRIVSEIVNKELTNFINNGMSTRRSN